MKYFKNSPFLCVGPNVFVSLSPTGGIVTTHCVCWFGSFVRVARCKFLKGRLPVRFSLNLARMFNVTNAERQYTLPAFEWSRSKFNVICSNRDSSAVLWDIFAMFGSPRDTGPKSFWHENNMISTKFKMPTCTAWVLSRCVFFSEYFVCALSSPCRRCWQTEWQLNSFALRVNFDDICYRLLTVWTLYDCVDQSVPPRNYVTSKATYIRLLHGKIGFWGFFQPP